MLRLRREKLESLSRSRAMTDPGSMIEDKRILLDHLSDRLRLAEDRELQMKKAEMAAAAGKLSALNPLAVISRGYSAVYRDDGALVKTIDDVKPGDRVAFKTIGGDALCTVDEIRKE